MPVIQTNTLIIGASISGLASAVCLQKKGIDYIIIEKQNKVASPWRNHYHRLHLHTNKRISGLPYKKFGRSIPRYPSREQVINYLDEYQQEFNIHPHFNTEATTISRQDDYWITETNNGLFKSKYLVMATGSYGKPVSVQFKGIETFPGKILHSSEYKTGKDYKDQKVLVVGFGNSACEIAIDLHEQGAIPSMSVRSPVNVIPRDIMGIPVVELSLLMNRLSPRIADMISIPLIRLSIGNIEKLGLKKMPYGSIEQIHRDAKAPILDIGTIKHIREGHIRIYKDIDHIAGNMVYFKDGKKENFDAIIASIGYERNYAGIADIDKSRFEDLKLPVKKQKYFGQSGLYFCGYWISPTGQIREIASDALKIAKDIITKENQSSSHN